MLPSPQAPSQVLSKTGHVIRTFVRVRDVKGDVACLNLGTPHLHYRGILKINTVNFALMSEEDQDALIEGFKGFLNGISFPIQILIRNLPYKLDGYLAAIDSIQGDLAEVARDHAQFVRQFASNRALVKRVFYIIVPADHALTRDRTEAFNSAQVQIKLRIDELLRQLERLGLTGSRLKDNEIISLYQSCFLSDEARQFPVSDGLIEGNNSLMMSAKERARLANRSLSDVEFLLGAEDTSMEEETIEVKRAKKARQNTRLT
jgi:hypothetical protein